MKNENTQNDAAIVEIGLDQLKIHPRNVRQSYEGIEELSASIKETGILQNLTVVPDPEEEGTYFVVIGNRRLMAARKAGLASAPCRIADMKEAEQIMSMITENMNRKGLKIHEEAAGIQMCLSDYGFTVEDVAQKTGLSETTVRHRANIAKLDRKALRERSEDGNFQLSITDLEKLEKVSSIAVRNKILREARDSRDLAWKAQSAADEEKRAKTSKKLVALAKKEGIEPASEETVNELYGNKWETVAEYDLTGDIPTKLYEGDAAGLFYVIQYRTLKIIRKAKKVKRELSECEKKEKESARKKRQIKGMYKEMYAQTGDFIRSIIDGRIKELKDTAQLLPKLWDILVSESAWVSRSNMLCAILGKDTYDADQEERRAASEKLSGLMLHQQMLLIAYCGCKDLNLADREGAYEEKEAEIFKKLYFCLALYGFSFENREFPLIMNGSHPLYKVRENVQEEKTENDGLHKAV